MISSRRLDCVPDVPGLRRLARLLATPDAVLAPEWEHRYYSFDSLRGLRDDVLEIGYPGAGGAP